MKRFEWLDPELSDIGDRARALVRSRMRATRAALSPSAAAARSQSIIAALRSLEPVQRATGIGLFWPRASHREVDLRLLDRELREQQRTLYYPFMDPSEDGGFVTGFRQVERAEDLQPRGRGFAEPAPGARVAARGDIDLVIVPALAVTPGAHRLGYGSGFYDVTLPELRPPALAIIVAYSFQLLAELPLKEHDVSCDVVVTDREVLDRGMAEPARSFW